MDRLVLEQRGPKNRLDPHRPYASLWEEEPDASGVLASTAVVFLTNRECAFRCVMCDLWKNTLDEELPPGVIPPQIRSALATLRPARQVKLYNAGSFFDPGQIPESDDEGIAAAVAGFERVIVESHPAFLSGAYGDRCVRFQSLIPGRLEVAIGLETADPRVLERINKRMTIDAFRRAAEFLHAHDIALRVFIMLNPPFTPTGEDVEWACRSIDLAAECGATACSVIPTRGYAPPQLAALESVVEYGLSRRAGPFGPASARRVQKDAPYEIRVFADLWDIERFYTCDCSPNRAARLAAMNRDQRIADPVVCSCDARH